MQAYNGQPAESNADLEASETRRRYEPPITGKRLRQQNPNYREGTHSRRRSDREHRFAGFLVMREALIVRCRREAMHGADAAPYAEWADQLARATPERLGLVANPRSRRDGDRHWTPWYIPDVALGLVEAALALCRDVMRALTGQHRATWRRELREYAKAAVRFLREGAMPQPMPPHTHREARGSEATPIAAASKESSMPWIQRAGARVLAAWAEREARA